MRKSDFLKPGWRKHLSRFGKILLILVTLPVTFNLTTDKLRIEFKSFGVPYAQLYIPNGIDINWSRGA